ncbi:ATR-interacting protein isoform X2 [Sceloporus undulatus]|uniref:ATR-interacting protein isoform X2 n=1 Tax=Sceloporus undulatus TaxID=8520 RepID=UPI001C4AA20C|nr:ATR-interacting protein isoform X2 [Sceloporus undulatus]
MSVNHLFGNKKRNSSLLYGVDQTRVTASFSSLQRATSQSNTGNHDVGFPPNKRYKTLATTGPKEAEDPFGDCDDFTAEDLEEIDIIATQALTQNVTLKPNASRAEQNTELPSLPKSTIDTTDHIKQWNISLTTETKSKGNSTEETSSNKFKLEILQEQYEEAKKKLKTMQDEILIKNGEIKILRDSMQKMESVVEEQRKSYVVLENEKAQTLNEKEKEFCKKLQSLQSELQFRDAEMNELRIKLLNCERIKPITTSVSYTSPKKSPPKIVKNEGCIQNEKKGYPTKYSFGSQISPKASHSKSQLQGQTPLFNKDSKMPELEAEPVKQEISYVCTQRQGSILINTLMKQPIVPESSLGLCYLLSHNFEFHPDTTMQPDSSNTGSIRSSSDRTENSQEEESSLRIAQKLALTGLNLIAVDEGSLEESSDESRRQISHPKRYKIAGAVHLLPLLDHHISAYHQALSLMTKTGNTSSGNQSACSSRSSSSRTSAIDDTLLTLEELALVSLGILYYLVFYSWDVIYTLLSHNMKPDSSLECAEMQEKDKSVTCSKQLRANPQEPNTELGVSNADQSQHPLFKKLLQLMASCATSAGRQRHGIMNQCLRVLVKLAERSTSDLLLSFQHLLHSQTQTFLRCISPETPLFAVHLTVKLLTLLAEHQELAGQFCSSSETCLLLALYMYITSRPDKSASEMLWLQLEQETVRFLTKCVQCCNLSVLLVGTECQCNSEVVKALIVMLHRQWLTVRKVEGNLFDVHGKQVIQFLRGTVLLLHSLSQKDKLFHEHCLEVLHQYDHVMPGVRAILRKAGRLKACEELALDELYPLEAEVDDQEMECN